MGSLEGQSVLGSPPAAQLAELGLVIPPDSKYARTSFSDQESMCSPSRSTPSLGLSATYSSRSFSSDSHASAIRDAA